MTDGRPSVTIAVATSDDEARVERCVRNAIAQDYPRELVEIVVADAMSMDATREIVLRLGEEDARVRLVENPQRSRAAGLNVALRLAHGEVLVPMDPAAEYGRNHVTKCVEALAASPAEHVALVPRTAGRTVIERALSAVQKTRLSFAANAELATGEELEPAVLGAVTRNALDRVGPFDEGMRVEEDAELASRLAADGHALAVRRDIVVHRTEASSYKELFRRHYRLGQARARRTLAEGRVRDARELVPLGLLAAGTALLVTSTVQPLTPVAVAAYALRTGRVAVRLGREEGLVTIPLAWAAFPVMHAAHGAGFGAGLLRAAREIIGRGRSGRKVST